MVIYEVNLEIDPSIYAEYMPWLDKHIQDILILPGFTKALLVKDQDFDNKISVQYHLESAASLDNYLKNFAPKMRADGVNKFQGKFTANRRILKINKEFNKSEMSAAPSHLTPSHKSAQRQTNLIKP